MEIKAGDKVRVREDAPRIYVEGWSCDWLHAHSNVRKTEGDSAEIELDCYALVIPFKHLIKVEDEAKEPKFKVGDKVKDISNPHDSGIYKVDDIKKSSDGFLYHIQGLIGKSNVKESDLEPYTEPTAPTIKVGDRVRCKNPIRLANSTDDDFIGIVTDNENGWFRVRMNNGAIFQTYRESDLELVQTEDEIIRQREAEFDEFRKEELDRVLHPEKYTTYEVTIDNVAMDWQRYTADLAHDIAVKIVNKNMGSDPKEAADYAVSVARAVVENLKKK